MKNTGNNIGRTATKIFAGIALSIALIMTNFAGYYPDNALADDSILIRSNDDLQMFDGTTIKPGSYKLDDGFQFARSVEYTVSGNVTIDMYHMINRGDCKIVVPGNSTLTLTTSFSGGTYDFDIDVKGGTLNWTGGKSTVIWNIESGEINISGGEIDYINNEPTMQYTGQHAVINQTGGNVGRVILNGYQKADGSWESSVYNMTGGTISGNASVIDNSNGIFNVSGTSVIDCNILNRYSVAMLNQSGGTINGNITNDWGGTFTQSGGTFTGSVTNTYGGSFTQTGGTRPCNIAITFDPTEGSLTATSATTVTGSDDSEKLYSLPTPVRTGYNCTGWFTAADDSGVQVDTTYDFRNSSVRTLYAHWVETPITHVTTPTPVPRSVINSQSDTEGSSSGDESDSDNYFEVLNNSIEQAIALGGKQTVYLNEGTSLPYGVMKTLQEHPNLTLVFSYRYEGRDYKVTIPGSLAKADTNIPWYGPLYLYGKYGGIGVNANASENKTTGSSYSVKQGDTLSAIAARLHTTTEHLAELNGITNPDRISIGQRIIY